ncbi:hypothetical protein [Sphingopyxis sp. DBS4]|uniref:hypothetical protein n=1 Tax=Sphingopyxis sp. DBS4 TaxID=2968500 RepID=UPI00214BFA3C|nr:hypothetical protein [Sphingopyxis sp. DBS4]
MTNMHVDTRLRPTRFGFLVVPSDRAALATIFEISTCLWGGKYNPIIPVFASRPVWWDRGGPRIENAEQIINGYLDYFEPDILVETRPGQAEGMGYASERVITLQDVAPPSKQARNAWIETSGLDVGPLYRHLYEREFQFARNRPVKVVRISPEQPSLANLVGCLFGAFPQDGAFNELEHAFDEVFAPDHIILSGDTAADLIANNWLNPLRITHDGLEVEYCHRIDPRVFVFDGTHSGDLIDYWNLRAGVQPVVPIPIQYASELGSFVREFVKLNYRPLPGNSNGVMIHPTVMFGRSIATEAIEPLFEKHFRVDIEGANCVQPWYPAFWRPTSDIMVSPTRPKLTAAEASHSLPLDEESPALQFDMLKHPFADRFGGQARWANVVKLSDWSRDGRVATTYPEEYRESRRPNFGGGLGKIRSTSEGFVELADYVLSRHYWQLESNASAITTWLADRNIKTVLSDSGRATQQIVQTLGGLHRVSSIANPAIVQFLEKISRRPISKSMEHNQFRNRIAQAVKGNLWNRDAVRTLIEQNAVELGLEVRCDKCGSWSWYQLSGLDTALKCGLCLKTFAFPAIDPTGSDRARWAYRLIGPFAQPNYAQGGYAAALSIRLFAELLESGPNQSLTWCAGQEMSFPNGPKIEADFILWYRRREIFGNTPRTQLVFGEAKSFGKECFGADDVARMKALSLAFPGAILVFATMKPASELSRDEIKRLSSLALWGRHYERQRRQSRAPVIILTGTELFSDYAVSKSWEKFGGRHAEFVKPAYVRLANLRVLADLTQQLYLGLEPYHNTERRKWARRSREKGGSQA